MKTITNIIYSAFALFAFACFALLPVARAAAPPKPEDRGNGNSAAENVSALNPATTGEANTAHGWFSLSGNTTGDFNTADGFQALFHNLTGFKNVAIGWGTLVDNTTGFQNTANGAGALNNNTTGIDNTAVGAAALFTNTTGRFNTATGFQALAQNTTGQFNTAIGHNALFNNSSGGFSVALGAGAGSGVTTANDVICIGSSVAGVNVNGTCFIGNIRGVTTQNANTLPVLIDGAGQLGTASSSQRFKHDIKPMGKASEAILALEPVTFHYKSDSTNIPQFGLIAEDVEKVNPDLIVRDKNGEIYTVRYDVVNAMLLNEFLKEHSKVEKLETTVASLAATVKEQAALIQKVSAQLEVRGSAPKTVLNNR